MAALEVRLILQMKWFYVISKRFLLEQNYCTSTIVMNARWIRRLESVLVKLTKDFFSVTYRILDHQMEDTIQPMVGAGIQNVLSCWKSIYFCLSLVYESDIQNKHLITIIKNTLYFITLQEDWKRFNEWIGPDLPKYVPISLYNF